MKRPLLLFAAALLAAVSQVSAQPADVAAAASDAAPVPLVLPVQHASLSLLYSNGAVANSAGTGVGGADESIIEAFHGGTPFFGFGAQQASGNVIADDFTLDTAVALDSLVFFAYQTLSDTASTITGVYVEIYAGSPADSGLVVYGDRTTNRLLDSLGTYWSGVYRVTASGTGTNADRPIMRVVADVDTTLEAGTYWLAFNFSGFGSSGPWAPPVATMGACNAGNALQSVEDGPYTPVANGDCPSDEVPFEVWGEPTVIAVEGDPETSTFRLGAAHPNPTRDAARLSLSVDQTQRVRAEAYDLLGRRVAVLHDGFAAAGTPVALTLDVRRLPAGVYVVRVVGEGGVAARRVTVAR